MKKTNKILRSLLGASALTAFAVGSANVALGAVSEAIGDARFGAVANWNPAAPAVGDSITTGGYDITVDAATAVAGFYVDKAGSDITVSVTGSAGSITNDGAANTAKLFIAEGKQYDLTGTQVQKIVGGAPAKAGTLNDYTGLGAVTIGKGGTLHFKMAGAGATIITSTIDGAAADEGTLKIDTTVDDMTFSGVIGGTKKLNLIDVAGVMANEITLGVVKATTLNFSADTAVNLGGNNSVVTNVTTATKNTGTLNYTATAANDSISLTNVGTQASALKSLAVNGLAGPAVNSTSTVNITGNAYVTGTSLRSTSGGGFTSSAVLAIADNATLTGTTLTFNGVADSLNLKKNTSLTLSGDLDAGVLVGGVAKGTINVGGTAAAGTEIGTVNVKAANIGAANAIGNINLYGASAHDKAIFTVGKTGAAGEVDAGKINIGNGHLQFAHADVTKALGITGGVTLTGANSTLEFGPGQTSLAGDITAAAGSSLIASGTDAADSNVFVLGTLSSNATGDSAVNLSTVKSEDLLGVLTKAADTKGNIKVSGPGAVAFIGSLGTPVLGAVAATPANITMSQGSSLVLASDVAAGSTLTGTIDATAGDVTIEVISQATAAAAAGALGALVKNGTYTVDNINSTGKAIALSADTANILKVTALTADSVGVSNEGTVEIDSNNLPTLNFAKNDATVVTTAKQINNAVTTYADGKGTLEFRPVNDATISTSIGASGFSLKTLKVSNAVGKKVTIASDVYAQNISFNSNAKTDVIEVNGNINGKFAFTANGGILNLNANSTIGAVDSSALGVANSSTVNLAATGLVTKLSGDVNATTVNAGQGTVKATKDLEIDGALNLNGTSLDIGTQKVSVTGLTTFDNHAGVTVAISSDGKASGKLALEDAKVNAAGNINVRLEGSTLPSNGATYNILTVSGTGADSIAAFQSLNALNVTLTSSLVKGQMANGTLTLTHDAAGFTKSIQEAGGPLSPSAKEALGVLTADMNKVSGNALQVLYAISSATDPAEGSKAAEGLGNGYQNGSTAASSSAVSSARSAMGSRVEGGAPLGLSSGDDSASSFGVWAKTFGGRDTQQTSGGTVGYKSSAVGGIVGIDSMVNDSVFAGVAFGATNTKIKFKDVKSGSKSSARTYLFAGYGSYNFACNWLLEGSAVIGNSQIKTSSKRGIGGAATAKGKFDSMTYSAELLAGYKYATQDASASVTPLAGLRATVTSDGAYTETGAGIWNQKIQSSTNTVIEGVIGARANRTIEMNNLSLTPEMHGSMSYDLKGKAPKVGAVIDGFSNSIVTKGPKPIRAKWNIGAGLTAKTGSVEYGFGVDADFSKKYLGYQGSMKVRVSL